MLFLLWLPLWLPLAAAQFVPEPYGWACFRMAQKRGWPQCAAASRADQRACLCSDAQFVALTESCLANAVANASNAEELKIAARSLSLCPLLGIEQSVKRVRPAAGSAPTDYGDLPEFKLAEPITADEIAIALSTAEWRMTNDRRAERAGAALVGFWAAVLAIKYVAHLLGRLPTRHLCRVAAWRPVRLVRARFFNAPLGARQHCEPWLKSLGIRLPTRAIYVVLLLFTALNYVLVFTDFPYTPANFIYPTRTQQWNKSLAIRCAFVVMWKLPLLVCFAGRNNVLLLLGHPWPLDTFNTFHKWIARLTIVDVVIHGIAISLVKGEQALYRSVWAVAYWAWGVVGACLAGFLLVQSMHWVSRRNYELFKLLHWVAALLFVVATFLHVRVLPYGTKHVYAVAGIWGFDVVCRGVRLLCAGRVRARIEHAAPEVVLLRMPAPKSFSVVRAQSPFVFLHLPPWYVFWQSHPFTVLSSSCEHDPSEHEPSEHSELGELKSQTTRTTQITQTTQIESTQIESTQNSDPLGRSTTHSTLGTLSKQETNESNGSNKSNATHSPNSLCSSGELTLAIQGRNGITQRLARLPDGPLTVALDGPYGTHHPLHRFDRVLCVAGGIGITAHLSYIRCLAATNAEIRLVWAVRDLRDHLWAVPLLARLAPRVAVELYTPDLHALAALPPGVALPPDVLRNMKLSCHDAVRAEVERLGPGDPPQALAIFACGPDRLNDDARLAACWAIENAATYVDYFEDTFSW